MGNRETYEKEPEEREITRRRVFIRTVDVKQYGGSPDCPGCDWVKRNKRGPKREHTEKCRERMNEFMRQAGDRRLERYEENILIRTITLGLV